jgi:carboxyl-terminal processing protease
MENKVVKILAILIFMISIFMLVERITGNSYLPGRTHIGKVDQVYNLVKELYVDDIADSTLDRSAVEGLLSELDPHSIYLSQEELKGSDEEMKGEFEGIGVEYQIIKDTINIITTMPGGPSETRGVLPGDKILSIDDTSAINLKANQVRSRIKGKSGTSVKLGISRFGIKNIIYITIKRGKIPVKSVTANFMLDSVTGYFNIVRFGAKTSSEVLEVLNSLQKQGMKQVIIDLRNNPGGYLNEAVKIADYFLDDGKDIVSTKGRLSQFNVTEKAENEFPYEKLPLIILINRTSASASEIFAGAIQDWDRGLVIGERSFGKGLVQQQIELNDGSAVRLTIAKYYTPLGRSIQRDYKNKEEYYSEIDYREELTGDNIDHQKDSTKNVQAYLTPAKRKVFGGGGITPDYFIGLFEDKKEALVLLKNNFFSQVALSWYEKNGKNIKSKFGDEKIFSRDFSFTQQDINSFINFASSININLDLSKSPKSLDYIKNRIKSEVARYIWNQQGFYYNFMRQDDVVLKAISLFGEAKKISRLK